MTKKGHSKIKSTRFLYEGSYSCVYHPSPLCHRLIEQIKKNALKNPEDNNNYVGKMILPQDSFIEWKNAKKIFKMDPLQEYFIYPVQVCENVPVRTSTKCHLIKKGQKIHALYIPYEPHTLLDYVIKRKKKIPMKEWISMLYHLMQGLNLLHDHKMIHQDIKINNVLVTKGELLKWIDFGISMNAKDIFNIEKNGFYLHTEYVFHPPEYRYFSRYYYIEKKIEQANFFADHEWYMLHFTVAEINVRNIDLYRIFYDYESYKKEMGELFKTLKGKTKEELQTLFTQQVDKVDVYGLGLMLLHVYPYIEVNKTETSQLYFTMIKNMIHPNIFKRYTTSECLRDLQHILQKL